MGDDFAAVYEAYAEQITGFISREALRMVGNVGPGSRIIDIAAGSGALAVPAAQAGAMVTAIDIAPDMVERLGERLAPYPDCIAAVMNGEILSFPDEAFDSAFSVFGVIFSAMGGTGFKNNAESFEAAEKHVSRPGRPRREEARSFLWQKR